METVEKIASHSKVHSTIESLLLYIKTAIETSLGVILETLSQRNS